jgi:predicted HTH transcriptional regulator
MAEVLSVHLSDEEILSRLRNFEDQFVERKSAGDWKKDALNTIVAFANSCPVGFPGILFIGVRKDGTVEDNLSDLDSLQMKLSEQVNNGYPPICFFARVLREAGRQFLAVLVPGSEARPHFTGHSYVRVGSETRKASEQQFKELIAQRTHVGYEILRSKGKLITIERLRATGSDVAGPVVGYFEAVVEACDAHCVTLRTGKDFQSVNLGS